ncbi:M15 family metallopeptidase [Leptodesmis sp.]|uniref:M15 family metallopeptidase n=1 Tax=Leptodesmis sp. TaxID=3100501 RepID=UPI004053522E
MPLKPYKLVPIQECGEPLVAIPSDPFTFIHPHPYERLGAPYDDKSPFYVRQGVLERLLNAQSQLQKSHPGWKIQIFDAYRPLAVQQFMVDHTFAEVLQQKRLTESELTELERAAILELVYEFWALPDPDPAKPPPHSTGGAVDITLVDATAQVVDMGSPIDELSPRSYPNHFATSKNAPEQTYHAHRELLNWVMTQAGFQRHPGEWWHFCYGDQMWAWLMNQADSTFAAIACYGRVA